MTITPHDIGTYQVESGSRPGEHHIVDVEARHCTCEAFADNRRKFMPLPTCKHLEAVFRKINQNHK